MATQRPKLEIRTITTSEMLNAYSTWPGLAQVYRGSINQRTLLPYLL